MTAVEDGDAAPQEVRAGGEAIDPVGELLRVLAYPKFRLSAEEQHELLADYLPFTASVQIPQPPPIVPVCRDPLDAPVLELTVAGQAKLLVSGDKDLLVLAGKTRFGILTPADFLRRLGEEGPQPQRLRFKAPT